MTVTDLGPLDPAPHLRAVDGADPVDAPAAERAVRDLLRGARTRSARRAPRGHPASGRRGLRGAAVTASVPAHHVLQRRGLRRARHRPRHPLPLAVPAPPPAVHRRGARRATCPGAASSACRSWPGSWSCSPATSRSRNASPSRSPTCSRRAPAEGRRCRPRGRAPLHVAARRPGARRPDDHLRPARARSATTRDHAPSSSRSPVPTDDGLCQRLRAPIQRHTTRRWSCDGSRSDLPSR